MTQADQKELLNMWSSSCDSSQRDCVGLQYWDFQSTSLLYHCIL